MGSLDRRKPKRPCQYGPGVSVPRFAGHPRMAADDGDLVATAVVPPRENFGHCIDPGLDLAVPIEVDLLLDCRVSIHWKLHKRKAWKHSMLPA